MDAAIDGAGRGADELGPDQRGGQPARAARRPGAARPVSRVHVHVRARAGVLPPQPGACQQSRAALECRQPPRLSRGSGTRAETLPRRAARARSSSSACGRRSSGYCAPSRRAPRGCAAAGITAARRDRLARRARADPVHDQERPARRTIRSACWRCRASELVRVHASSGTHGKPTVVAYTRGDLETWTELMARCMTMAGVRPGMTIHNANGYGLFTGGLGFHQGGERIGATVVPVSGGLTGAPGDAADATSAPRCSSRRRRTRS